MSCARGETINAVQSEMVHAGPNLLLRHGPLPRQQLRSVLTNQEALDDFELEFCLELLYATPWSLSNSWGGSSNPGRFSLIKCALLLSQL